MPLTPADIHNMAFKKPSIGKRGYDEEEVDAFLDEVEREIERLADENSALRAQVELGAGGGAGDGWPGAELQQLRAQLDRSQREWATAEQAAQDAQRQLELARAQVRGAVFDEEGKGLPVLMMAQRTADEHLSKARFEADELLAEIHAQAQGIVRDAQAQAQQVEAQAVERHQEAIEGLDVKRADVHRQIMTLTHFAQDYRRRLQEHLLGLMNDPSGAGSKTDQTADGTPAPVHSEI